MVLQYRYNSAWFTPHKPQFGLSCSRSRRIVYDLGHTPASSAHNPRITADSTQWRHRHCCQLSWLNLDTLHDLTIRPWLHRASYSGLCWTDGCCVEAGAELARSTWNWWARRKILYTTTTNYCVPGPAPILNLERRTGWFAWSTASKSCTF